MAEQRHEPQVSIENAEILVSGAGAAGPVLAYWLKRYGFDPTVVERAPEIRKAGVLADTPRKAAYRHGRRRAGGGILRPGRGDSPRRADPVAVPANQQRRRVHVRRLARGTGGGRRRCVGHLPPLGTPPLRPRRRRRRAALQGAAAGLRDGGAVP